MKNKCFECETTEDLQQHHVVPRSRGGTSTITLCHSCHMKAHGRDSKGLNQGRLIKEGLARAKARGVKIGQPKAVLDAARLKANETCRAKGDATKARYKEIFKLIRSEGITSIRKTAERLETLNIPTPTGKQKWSLRTTSRIMKSIKQEE